jgi:hypothetical protein
MKNCKDESFVSKMIKIDMEKNKYEKEEESLKKLIPLLTSSLEMINCKRISNNTSELEPSDKKRSSNYKPIYIVQSLILPTLPLNIYSLSHFLYVYPIFFDFSSFSPSQTGPLSKSDFPMSYYSLTKSPKDILIEIRVKDNDDDLIGEDDSILCIFNKHNWRFLENNNNQSGVQLPLTSSYYTTINYHQQTSFLNDEVKISIPFQSQKPSTTTTTPAATSTTSSLSSSLISNSIAPFTSDVVNSNSSFSSLLISSIRKFGSFSKKTHILFTFYNLSGKSLDSINSEEEKDKKKISEGSFSFFY